MLEYDAILKRLEDLKNGEAKENPLLLHVVRAAVGLRQALDQPLVSTNVNVEHLRDLQSSMKSFDYCVSELVADETD